MGEAEGRGDVAGGGRQDGETVSELGDEAQVVHRLGLDQHADGTDAAKLSATGLEPLRVTGNPRR